VTAVPVPTPPGGSNVEVAAIRQEIERGWEDRDRIGPKTGSPLRAAVDVAINLLDKGELRAAEKIGGTWRPNEWVKKAILLSFRLNPARLVGNGPGNSSWCDIPPLKAEGWGMEEYAAAGFRAVPGSVVRRGAFVGKGAVLMPSFINIGAYVGERSMIDTWATVGSCAQIGSNVHISGGAGIGGVLEPLQAAPVIVEDGCFIGARAEIAEGVIVEEGAVIGMGVFISASTKIVNRATGEIFRGRVPAYSVVVPGSLPDPDGGPSLYCAVIVKQVDARTRAKTSINELVRH
jgi:2,3,4,5-tetrahydropyridine-2-carboxylate N-succinyltransferase